MYSALNSELNYFEFTQHSLPHHLPPSYQVVRHDPGARFLFLGGKYIYILQDIALRSGPAVFALYLTK